MIIGQGFTYTIGQGFTYTWRHFYLERVGGGKAARAE